MKPIHKFAKMGPLICWPLLALAGCVFPASEQASEQALISEGEVHYRNNCAICHGFAGEGGRGPSLRQARFRRAPNVTRMEQLIAIGIPGTEMPRSRWLTDEQTNELAKFVLSMGRAEVQAVPGDPQSGRALYNASDCADCHIISGSGRAIGPELTRIGERRTPKYLREALLRPEAQMPEGFAIIRAIDAQGRNLEGIRLNEDSYTVQFRDLGGQIHSLRKPDLRLFRKELKRTPMNSYEDQLGEDEITDLVAYLAGLREEL